MSGDDIEAEVHDLIEAWAHGAGEGRSLPEFLGLTNLQIQEFSSWGELPDGYVPPVHFRPTSPARVDEGVPIADFYRSGYSPARPLATFILALMGIACLAWIAFAALAHWGHG